MSSAGAITVKKIFGVLPIDDATCQNQIWQPQFIWEWQGIDTKHVTNVLGHGRSCVRKHTRVYSGTEAKGLTMLQQ